MAKVIGKSLEETKIAEIERLAAYSYSNPKIAEIIGVHKTTVGKYRRKLGLAPYRSQKKISDEDIIFLKRLGCSLLEIAKMKNMGYGRVYIHAKRLTKLGYFEIISKEEYNITQKAKFQKQRTEKAKIIIEFLNSRNGVVHIGIVPDISGPVLHKILREHSETFELFNLEYGRPWFLKTEYLGKVFLALRANKTAIVRFFMKIFKERKNDKEEYNKHDIKVITSWLRGFGFSRAERVAIITKLGYRFSSFKGGHLGHMKIDGYLDHKPRTLRRKPLNT